MSGESAPVLSLPPRILSLSDSDRRAIIDEVLRALRGQPLQMIARAVVKEVTAELRPLSHKRDMPLSEVAVKLGKHPSTVRKWARGKLYGWSVAPGRAGREMIIRLPEGVML